MVAVLEWRSVGTGDPGSLNYKGHVQSSVT